MRLYVPGPQMRRSPNRRPTETWGRPSSYSTEALHRAGGATWAWRSRVSPYRSFAPTRRSTDRRSGRLRRCVFDLRFGAPAEPVQVQINDRRGIERKHLRHDQSANDRNTKRFANFRTIPLSEGQRDRTKQGRQSGHHDRSKPNNTSLVDRLGRGQSLVPFRLQREVDHHDRVLLYDPDQENNSDNRDDGKIDLAN